uniref:Uncharacterized protein n=1 Tax=Arundo donax TaxID=35708 RepID=A0A0A9H949_ARUDO
MAAISAVFKPLPLLPPSGGVPGFASASTRLLVDVLEVANSSVCWGDGFTLEVAPVTEETLTTRSDGIGAAVAGISSESLLLSSSRTV